MEKEFLFCVYMEYRNDHRALENSVEQAFKEKEGYKRIYIDLLGMGRTGQIKGTRCADDVITLLKKFIEKVIGNQNFLLVGQSYGGYLVLGLLYHLRERVKGMFFICPCLIPDRKKRDLPLKEELYTDKVLLGKYGKDHSFRDFIQYTAVRNERTWQRYKDEILPGLKIADSDFIYDFQEKGYELSFHCELKDIQFGSPVSILTGKKDICVGYKDALSYLANFESITFSVIDNTGHNLQIEQEKLFNEHMEEWLDRIEFLLI